MRRGVRSSIVGVTVATLLGVVGVSVDPAGADAAGPTDRRLHPADIARFGRSVSATRYIGAPQDYCFAAAHGRESGYFTPGIEATELAFDCTHAKWLFGITTSPGVDIREFDGVELWLDVDRRTANGCEGFDTVVFGGYDEAERSLYVGALRTPTCTRSTWTAAGRTTLLVDVDVGFFAIEFEHGRTGSPTNFNWSAYAYSEPAGGSGTYIPASGTYFTALVRPSGDPFVRAFVRGPAVTIGDHDLAAGTDVNGDGYGDVLLIGHGDRPDRLLLGRSTGGFTTGPTPNLRGDWRRAATGDFDGDGKGDILLYGATTSTDRVLYGRRTAAFAPVLTPATFLVGATSVVAGDFDGDSVSDVVLWKPGGQGVQYWRGRTDRTLLMRSARVTQAAAAVLAGDFNGDGRDDLLMYGKGAARDEMFTLDSLGRLFAELRVALPNYYSQAFAGNWNGDAVDDLLFYAPGTASERALFGRSNRAFVDASPVTINGSYRLVIVDVNGDGRDDLVLWGPGTRPDQILLGSGR